MDFTTPQLDVVPIVHEDEVFSTLAVHAALENLRVFGSYAELGFMKPEGVVVFHHASRQMFKATLVGDEAPKSKFAGVPSARIGVAP
jgi:hypothetical protein